MTELGRVSSHIDSRRKVREFVEEYVLGDDTKTYLLGEERLINLVAGQGNPVEIMDTSFALQALSVHHLATHHTELAPRVYPVPPTIDEEVARTKLRTMGVRIDSLREAQQKYLPPGRRGPRLPLKAVFLDLGGSARLDHEPGDGRKPPYEEGSDLRPVGARTRGPEGSPFLFCCSKGPVL